MLFSTSNWFFSQKIHLILSACSFPQNHQGSRICTLQQPNTHNKVHCPFNNEKRWARLLSDLIFPAHLNRLFPKSVRESALLLSFNRGFNCRNFCSSQLRQFTIWIHICSLFKEKRGGFQILRANKKQIKLISLQTSSVFDKWNNSWVSGQPGYYLWV